MTKFGTSVSAYSHHASKVDLPSTFPPGNASPLGMPQDNLKVSTYILSTTLRPLRETNQMRLWDTCTHCLKVVQNVAFDFWHFPPKTDLSGNTI